MLQINSNKLKFRGQQLNTILLFLNTTQHCNGKDLIIEFYPYLSVDARKDDTARNHLRHELFYLSTRQELQPMFVDEVRTEIKVDENGSPVMESVTVQEWKLLEDLKIETPGHLEFFSKDVWSLINAEVKQYLVGLGVCNETDITEV
jgi:hypothetical protein